MDSLQIIIICCNEERRRFQQKQMEDLELPYAFFDAYTPTTMGDYITEKYIKNPEADTMICATRSHIEAIDFFCKQYPDKQYGIFFEDDVIIVKDFLSKVETTINAWKPHQKEIDYVSLGFILPDKKIKCKNTSEQLNWNLEEALWGQQCYIIGRDISLEIAKLLVQKNTEELYSVYRKRRNEVVRTLGYAYKQVRLQPDTIIPNLFRQGFVWPPIAIEYQGFNSCISYSFSNQIRYKIIDFNPDDFYNPNKSCIITPYVINLKHRKDRWQEVQEEFKKLDIIPHRIEAVLNKEKGYMGSLASHIIALKEGLHTNLPVWICEDDIQFLQPKYKLFNLIEEFLKSDGDILCIAHNTWKKTEYNHLFVRAVETQTTGSYIIKPSFLPILLQLWEEVYDCYYQNKKHSTEHLFLKTDGFGKTGYYCADICWKILQPYYTFLVPKERYAIQRESYSDIEHKIVKYV